jgi:hypothetical protein
MLKENHMHIRGILNCCLLIIFGVILLLISGCAANQPSVEKGPVDLRAGLVAWYTFDEASEEIAHDLAGGHDGKIFGAVKTDGKIGGALEFDGVNDCVVVPDEDGRLNIRGDITIAAWVNFRKGGLNYDGSEKAIVTKCIRNGTIANPYDFRSDISIEPLLTMVRASNQTHECAYSKTHITLGRWHHVLVRVKDMETNFYVDGVLTEKWWGVPPLKGWPAGNDHPMLIGARDDGLFFNGMIDEVRIYDRALTVKEIKALQNYIGGVMAMDSGKDFERGSK